MPIPEGWEWIEEFPRAWIPPEELRVPTRITSTNLLIMMLSSDSLDNGLVDLVGQLLSEKARFNAWVLLEAKEKGEPQDLATLSLVVRNQSRSIYEAWKAFINAREVAGGMAGTFDAEESALKRALVDAISNIVQARGYFDGAES